MESSAIILIASVYFLLMIAIGAWANRKTTSSKEFLVAGQSLGFFVMAIATFSSIQSGWGMVGSTGTVYDWGLQALIGSALLIPLGFALAWFLLGAPLRRIAQRYEVYSIPDLIRIRYRSRAAHIAMSVAMLLGTISYMTAQITAMGVIMSLLVGTSVSTGVWIGALIVGAYTVAGGMLAAVWTDLIQGLLMIAASLAVFFTAISLSGGWSATLSTLGGADSSLLAASGSKPATWILAYAIMIVFGAAGQPQLVTKFLMLRDRRELRWGALVAGVAYAVTTLFSIGVGLALRAMVVRGQVPAVDNVDNAATYFLGEVMDPVLGGIALTALLAAIMSSASSFITIGASAVMRDLAGGLGIRVRNDLLWGRVWSAVVVLASVLLTLYLEQIIYLLGAFGWAAFAAAIFGPVAFSLYWKRATGAATVAAIVVGLGVNFVTTILQARDLISLPDYFYVGGISVVLSTLVFIVVSVATPSTADESRFDALYTGARAPVPAATHGTQKEGVQS